MAAKSAGSLILYVVLGGLCGALLSQLVGGMVASDGFLHDVLVRGFQVGLTNPLVVDLRIVVMTFGLHFDLTVPSLAGMIAGLYLAMK